MIEKKYFLEDNSIMDYINQFKEYLSNLSVCELCNLISIFLSVFIFTCLISIIFAFYGNYLLNKFN